MTFVRQKHADRAYRDLIEGTHQLHKDIADLETAYLLHNKIVQEDENSVRGIIRKEVGGSRWAHGGEGKLTTYKSSKDLIERKGSAADHRKAVSPGAEKSNQNGMKDMGEHDENTQDFTLAGSNLDKNQMLDLKTKVLKKASSNIIRRDKWSVSPETPSRKTSKGDAPLDKNSQPEKRRVSLEKVSKPKQSKLKESKVKKQKPKPQKADAEDGESSKQSRLDSEVNESHRNSGHGDYENRVPQESDSGAGNHVEDLEPVRPIGVTYTPRKLRSSLSETKENTNSENFLPGGATYTPRKFQPQSNGKSQQDKPSKVFYTEPPEPSEIIIDPKTGQVRVTAGSDDNLRHGSCLDGMKVLIQSRSLQNSVDDSKGTCSIVENSASPRKQVRGFLCDEDFVNVGSSRVGCMYGRQSLSPSLAARRCNSEVEFWLRSLGIPDVDKYVGIFADNEIDLTDLEFMSASQLHDMGITTFGALDKILKGIRDLKNQPGNYRKEKLNGKTQVLHSSSLAWEETKDNKVLGDRKIRASNDNDSNSCQEDACLKHSFEFLLCSGSDRKLLRSNSARSDITETVDSGRNSERSETPSFAASTKSSSAKCTDKRPPSAKTASGSKNSKSGNQSKTKNIEQSTVKLKRSNSTALEKASAKLANLDVKPTKGVLIRPRSASVTRDAPRKVRGTSEAQVKDIPKHVKETSEVKQDKAGKKSEEKRSSRQTRNRSRSADVVKRKALEGVQAAAKKFEERSQKQKESDWSFSTQDERLKLRRDEMAARHLEREKFREMTVMDQSSSSSDTDNDEHPKVPATPDIGRGLESLVTVNILSPPSPSAPSESKSSPTVIYVLPPINRKVLHSRQSRGRSRERRSEARQSLNSREPHNLPVLSTYKLSHKDRDKSHSEPESGYKTDSSTSYSQIEDKVSDIQLKIKRLKAQATSGDEMTLTLVHDLQLQLAQFEQQLKNRERDHQSDPESTRVTPFIAQSRPAAPIRPTPRKRSEVVNPPNNTPREPDQQEEEVGVAEGVATDGEGHSVGAGVRMSKQELIKEMRKEKQVHNRQIRQLQSELLRFRHVDAVSSMELNQVDITFKQQDMIGEGKFSRVYKGEYQGSEVAIKQLKLPLQQQDRNYFTAEVSLLKELRHPRVVLLIGVCTSTKLPMMVLEYMSRGSLYNYLHDPECESLDHALYYQVSRDIALGMNYLHSHKPEVLHLDLKSMNVLLCQSLRAKIADFGFSKLRLDAGLKSDRKSKIKSNASAPTWMSPELLDKGEVTGKSDVYSFGIILWEMLTRDIPYTDCSVFQVIEMVRKNQRPEIPDGTPEGLAHLIKLCWDPNPAKRPQFKDVLQILENLAFPPAWRELFQKAGVPDSALQDVQSTRTIISLVTGTLDSGRSCILHSFMVAHSKTENQSGRKKNKGDKSTNRSEKSSKSKSKRRLDEQSVSSSRLSDETEELWDSDTVTSVSEKLSSDDSEFTLKNLRLSSSEENSVSDSSSELSSDENGYIPKISSRKTVPKTEMHVVIPNLELSLQSVRDEFKAERQKISQGPDWTNISLDDRTARSELNSSQRTSLAKGDNGLDMKLRLLSSLSARSPSPALEDTVTVNESARSRRRNKTKDVNLYSEDFFRRESFDNRRPPSPKKKNSLVKNILESPGRPSIVKSFAGSEILSGKARKSDMKAGSAESFVEKSYDSFFDLSTKKTTLSSRSVGNTDVKNCNRNNNGSQNDEDTDVHSARKEQTERRIRSYDDNICLEDMENEVLSERLNEICQDIPMTVAQNGIDKGKEKSSRQEVKNIQPSDDTPTNGFKTCGLVNSPCEMKSGSADSKTQSEESQERSTKVANNEHLYNGEEHGRKPVLSNQAESTADDSMAQNLPTSTRTSLRTAVDKPPTPTLSNTEPENHKHESVRVVLNEMLASRDHDQPVTSNAVVKHSNNSTRHSEMLASGDRDRPDTYNTVVKQSNDKTRNSEMLASRDRDRPDTYNEVVKQSNDRTRHSEMLASRDCDRLDTSNTVLKHSNDRTRGLEMLASKDHDRQDTLNAVVKYNNNNSTRHSINASKTATVVEAKGEPSYLEEYEQIRVKLDLDEVEEKRKKPVITPRRSLQLQNSDRKTKDKDLVEHKKHFVDNKDMKQEKERASNAVSIAKSLDATNGQIDNRPIQTVETMNKSGTTTSSKSDSIARDSGSVPAYKSSLTSSDDQNKSKITTSKDLKRTQEKKDTSHKSQTETMPSPKKTTIRVKIRKDPLAAQSAPQCPSPVPPAPPPPAPEITRSVTVLSRSVQNQAPRSSMADELKVRLANRQSVTEGMLHGGKSASGNSAFRKQPMRTGSKSMQVAGPGARLVQISEGDEQLVPKQSDGLPSFVLHSMDLQDQREQLRSISKAHPNQLDDLSNASQEQLTSIAEILKKAVLGRRLALGEDGDSVSQSLESAATGWSIDA